MDLREAAIALGVHYQTAYAWVRDGQLPARKVGRGYQINPADLDEFAARRGAGREPARRIRVRDWGEQADGLYALLVAGDETAARQRLDRLAGGVTVLDLCDRIIAPALRRIGDDWAAGRLPVAAEHRASSICERLIAARATQPGGRPRGVAVVTTPPGERHGLPALMAAAVLREDHWTVHHLACDLPESNLGPLAAQVGADLVVLSAATPETAELGRRQARSLTAAPPWPRVLTGGPGSALPDLVRQAASHRTREIGG